MVVINGRALDNRCNIFTSYYGLSPRLLAWVKVLVSAQAWVAWSCLGALQWRMVI